jgi:hypothetical protein
LKITGFLDKMRLQNGDADSDDQLKGIRYSPLLEGYQKTTKYTHEHEGDGMPPKGPPGPIDFFIAHGSHETFTDAVTVDIKLIELIKLDEEAARFEAKFEMTLSWYDANFATPEWKNALKSSDGVEVMSYCAPSVEFLDVLDGDDGWHDHNGVAEVILGKSCNGEEPPAGMVSFKKEFTSTIRDDNPIECFPFDRQELTIELKMADSATRGTIDYGRYFVPLNVSVHNKHQALTWNYHRAVGHTTQPRGCEQHMVAAFRICRKPWTWVWNVMFILCMIGTMSLTSFLVPINALADRVQINLTLLLTVVAFKLLLSENLPKVSYLTFLDTYVIIAFVFIFIIAVENTGVAFLTGISHTVSCPPQKDGKVDEDCEPFHDGDNDLCSEYAWYPYFVFFFWMDSACWGIFQWWAGSWTMQGAQAAERWIVPIACIGWGVIHLYHFAWALTFLYRNKKEYGGVVDAMNTANLSVWNYLTSTTTAPDVPVFDAARAIDWKEAKEMFDPAKPAEEVLQEWENFVDLPQKRKRNDLTRPAAESFSSKELAAGVIS